MNLHRESFAGTRKHFTAMLRQRFVGYLLALLIFATAGFAQAPPAPTAILDPGTPTVAQAMEAFLRARQSVEKFFEQSANVVCTESVSQMVLSKNGKPFYREDSMFDYQLQANTNSGSLRLLESRETRKAAFRDSRRTLLITNGFGSMLLIIHPNYETSYTFEPAGVEVADGVTFAKIDFKTAPGAASPVAFQLRGQNYPVPLSGTIWINVQNSTVTKVIAAVDSSLSDLGLQGMRSEIHYAIVRFHDPDESYWMPVSATIDVETPRQHWRNVHRFTQYKRFSATIHVEGLESKP